MIQSSLSERTDGSRILLLSFATYLTAYLLRTNYSAALPMISEQLQLTQAQLGLAGSVFFVVYALGQLCNGFVSDAVNPYGFVILALAGTVTANFAMACSSRFWMLLVFWACNGYFQSIFWGCLQRILSLHFDEHRHSMVAAAMSCSMIAGFLCSWGLLRLLLQHRSWRGFFFYPALAGGVMLLLWLLLRRKTGSAAVKQLPSRQAAAAALRLIRKNGLYWVCGICLCLGFVKESISVWGPTLVTRLLHADSTGSALILMAIPLGNFGGIFLTKALVDHGGGRLTGTLAILFFVILAAGAGILITGERLLWITVGLIALISASSYGCNSVLLSMIPLRYARQGVVSTLIGLFDFTSYLGAALSSVLAGVLLTTGAWNRLAVLWVVFAAAALCFVAVVRSRIRQL